MQITPASLAAVFVAFDTRFQSAYQAAQPWYARLAMEVPSSTSETTYAWMAKIPGLREWVGERVVQNASSYDYSIKNRDFELTLEVDRNKIEDDQLGIFNPMLDMMGQQARKWPDDLIKSLISGGESTLCFDGQYFFDTDHPVDKRDPDKGTQSNLFAGTALTAANYAAVRASMAALKGEDGRPLGVLPNLLVVPPQLEGTARTILNAELIGGDTNVWRNSAELLVIPELADAPTEWYLFDVSRPVKPFVFQQRKAPEFTYITRPDSESVFLRKTYLYGVDARGNAGYALWFLAAKAKA